MNEPNLSGHHQIIYERFLGDDEIKLRSKRVQIIKTFNLDFLNYLLANEP